MVNCAVALKAGNNIAQKTIMRKRKTIYFSVANGRLPLPVIINSPRDRIHRICENKIAAGVEWICGNARLMLNGADKRAAEFYG
jgi:hypothetical protein